MRDSTITLDVLLTPGSDVPATTDTLDVVRPPAECMAQCLRWFTDRGIEAYPGDFSITLIGTVSVFTELFGVDLIETNEPGPEFAFAGIPELSPEISAAIQEITVTAKPDFFP